MTVENLEGETGRRIRRWGQECPRSDYADIVLQLRTAYDITFRSPGIEPGNRADPRLRVRMKKPGQFATVESIANAADR